MGFLENIISVWPDGRQAFMRCGQRDCPVVIGRSGVAAEKKEGDGATPAGLFALRRVFYRADRVNQPETRLPLQRLAKNDGWCDAPDDEKYNQWVRLPYKARAENLWRADGLYDIIIVIGFNDSPVRAHCGSAIFIHLAPPDGAPTRGCIALSMENMRAVLKTSGADTKIEIKL